MQTEEHGSNVIGRIDDAFLVMQLNIFEPKRMLSTFNGIKQKHGAWKKKERCFVSYPRVPGDTCPYMRYETVFISARTLLIDGGAHIYLFIVRYALYGNLFGDAIRSHCSFHSYASCSNILEISGYSLTNITTYRRILLQFWRKHRLRSVLFVSMEHVDCRRQNLEMMLW